jgi:regulator of replication initiation timing
MAGRVLTWLLDFAPTREAVRREVRVAVDHVMDETENAQTRLRERHRAALTRADAETADLRAKVEELTVANTDLLGSNTSLRGQVAELEEAAQREVTEREEFARLLTRERESALTRQWHGAGTDVFCCQSCWAFWFLSTTQDRMSCLVCGPYGRHDTTCTVCADPVVVLPAAKLVTFRKGADDRVPRAAPSDGPRSDTALANAELSAIADGLARLPKVASRTVAWVAADLTGSPELPAKVLGDIATRATMTVPLDGIVAGIRAFVEVGLSGR